MRRPWWLLAVGAVAAFLFRHKHRPPSLTAAVPPPSPTREFGVQIHPFITAAELALLLSIKPTPRFVRCDMGEDVPLALTDAIYGALLKQGITPLFITSRVQHTNLLVAYVDYHTKLAARYPLAWWELCNETNTAYFWGNSNPDAAAYAALVRSIAPRLREVLDSTSKILLGGTSGMDLRYIGDVLSSGVEELVDFVAFHPYGETADSLPRKLAALRQMTKKPLFSSEYGAPGDNPGQLTAMATACGNAGVPFIWYQLQDGAPNPLDANNTFGLFDAAGNPKAVLAAAEAYMGSG